MPKYYAQENIKIEINGKEKAIKAGEVVLEIDDSLDLQTILNLAQLGRIGDVAPKTDGPKSEVVNTIATAPAEFVIAEPGTEAKPKVDKAAKVK